MSGINTLDIKAFLSDAVDQVFATMLSMEGKLSDVDSNVPMDGDRIVGSVSFPFKVPVIADDLWSDGIQKLPNLSSN